MQSFSRHPFHAATSAVAVAAVSAALFAIGVTFSAPARAIGSLADVVVIDRNSGQTLPIHTYQGRHYVAGRPGARYAVRVYNRSNARVMAVMAVDGVNVVSGDTASWDQNGYVLSSWQRHDVAGWRKSQSEIAAFEFTALPNSYAARTGRPENVGVIGVALFREQPPAPPPAAMTPPPRPRPYGGIGSREDASRSGARTENDAGGSGTLPSTAPSSAPSSAREPAQNARKSAADGPSSSADNISGLGSTGEGRALSRPAPQPESKLGTGHGQRESAWVSYTEFQRAQSTPNEVIAIYYDSRENLVAQGVLPAPRTLPSPQPFPLQPQAGFVPDPPRF